MQVKLLFNKGLLHKNSFAYLVFESSSFKSLFIVLDKLSFNLLYLSNISIFVILFFIIFSYKYLSLVLSLSITDLIEAFKLFFSSFIFILIFESFILFLFFSLILILVVLLFFLYLHFLFLVKNYFLSYFYFDFQMNFH